MPASKFKFRRWIKYILLAIILLLLVPAVQVACVIFWNPSSSPMQFQRQAEAWRAGKKSPNVPIQWVKLSDTPKPLIHFIWSSEDQAFFNHHGFDMPQLRKAVASAQKGGTGAGASTITMQCARSLFLWQGRSYLRKALEAYYTVWMELLLGKQRILELYLNHIELGDGVYGIGAAAQKYFGRPASQLTREQMIALAAILPNPREWSPVKPDKTVRKKIRRIERLSGNAPFPDEKLKR